MLLAGLHPTLRNRTGSRIGVEFFPSRAPDLTTAGSSENTEFECTRCDALASGQLTMNSAISAYGNAGWRSTFRTFDRAGSNLSRCPFQRAGSSPCRYPRTAAQSRTDSIRPRTRLSVSGFVDKMGSMMPRIAKVSISTTVNRPIFR